jgi:sugar-specific transcriptional regulator TrmB
MQSVRSQVFQNHAAVIHQMNILVNKFINILFTFALYYVKINLHMSTITTTQLINIGLSKHQAKVYLTLLKHPDLSVQEIAKETTLQRTNVYHLLPPLLEEGLVKEKVGARKGRYEAGDPHALRAFVLRRQAETQQNAILLESVFPSLSSLFTMTREAPSIRSYEGVKGLRTMYEEMLGSGCDTIRLFRSTSDALSPEILAVVRWTREQQAKRGIKTLAITQDHDGAKRHYLNGTDGKNLVERRVVESHLLNNPAQILLWDNCVAISSLEGSVITTVLENEMIAQTFQNLFEYCWLRSSEEHEKITKQWVAEG